MKDLSHLTNQEVAEARKFFTNWTSTLKTYSGDVDLPEEERWRNFCKEQLCCFDDKISACAAYLIPVNLSEELANRFEKVLLG